MEEEVYRKNVLQQCPPRGGASDGKKKITSLFWGFSRREATWTITYKNCRATNRFGPPGIPLTCAKIPYTPTFFFFSPPSTKHSL